MTSLRSRTPHLLGLLACVALAACSGKEDDTGASTSTSAMTTGPSTTSPTTTETGGASSSSASNGGTSTSGGSSSGATTSDGTSGTSGTSGSTGSSGTTGGVCMIELPDPGRCNGYAPPSPKPTLAAVVGVNDGMGAPGHTPPIAAEDEDPDFATTGCAFICDTTGGGEPECDIWAQDCPDGEKCNAWANDGGGSWNATKCVPVDPEPDKVGEPCTAVGGGVSGVDSCELGAMCWGVDENLEGTCVELCTCSPDNPVCTTPNTTCTISNQGVLILCLPVCDPLDPGSCPDGDVCVAGGEYFQCVVDASGGAGAGDPCQYLNACSPGLFCADASLVPGCDGNACCASFCDLGQPDCQGGTECVAWYEEGQAPKCFEDVGACVAP